ncbi:hypothetical protein EMIHUDRAFT_432572 [Emiliania huxleyi CCMP1516]|uniref:Uncharacterized protein n=2 Tax=Emiliania huxleyi TaxID=2903 RepID=A0A0D3ITV5_EMIH1|nr:hypothetical protein EMIHUDRAFT_432572 [Emiliania huxleyi CCMP1516]EOD14690.1 hypothetical protein EMIHUDRAFT_432572 [Emiliania huxleyi CCMP1516]|eukprot:XP_005767119.1 hypothetical protein EMIHUDRAFT_432572 [Emiliania huxleyi CCMP1516]
MGYSLENELSDVRPSTPQWFIDSLPPGEVGLSFCAGWPPVAKAMLVVVMIYGRTRALPQQVARRAAPQPGRRARREKRRARLDSRARLVALLAGRLAQLVPLEPRLCEQQPAQQPARLLQGVEPRLAPPPLPRAPPHATRRLARRRLSGHLRLAECARGGRGREGRRRGADRRRGEGGRAQSSARGAAARDGAFVVGLLWPLLCATRERSQPVRGRRTPLPRREARARGRDRGGRGGGRGRRRGAGAGAGGSRGAAPLPLPVHWPWLAETCRQPRRRRGRDRRRPRGAAALRRCRRERRAARLVQGRHSRRLGECRHLGR